MKKLTLLKCIIPLTALCTATAQAAPASGLFGCESAFGQAGTDTWLAGVDLKEGNLITTKLITNKVDGGKVDFGAAEVDIKQHVVGTDKKEEIAAGDPSTFCQNLNISVGGQLQLHWQGSTLPEIVAQGGGIQQLSCFYGTVKDPFTNNSNPVLLCVSQGPSTSNGADILQAGYTHMNSQEVISRFCTLAKEDGHDYNTCAQNIKNAQNNAYTHVYRYITRSSNL